MCNNQQYPLQLWQNQHGKLSLGRPSNVQNSSCYQPNSNRRSYFCNQIEKLNLHEKDYDGKLKVDVCKNNTQIQFEARAQVYTSTHVNMYFPLIFAKENQPLIKVFSKLRTGTNQDLTNLHFVPRAR